MANKEGILVPAIDRYVNDILPKRDPVLAEMERLEERENSPIIVPCWARLLALMAAVDGARGLFWW